MGLDRDAEHGRAFDIVPREPRHDLLRGPGAHQNLESPLRNPLTTMRSKDSCLPPAMWPCCSVRDRWRPGIFRPASRRESESSQRPASVMRREVSTVNAGGQRDDLFGREASAVDHRIVIGDRLGQCVRHRLSHGIRIDGELPFRDRDGHMLILTPSSLTRLARRIPHPEVVPEPLTQAAAARQEPRLRPGGVLERHAEGDSRQRTSQRGVGRFCGRSERRDEPAWRRR